MFYIESDYLTLRKARQRLSLYALSRNYHSKKCSADISNSRKAVVLTQSNCGFAIDIQHPSLSRISNSSAGIGMLKK
jgi:hypothetical protein